jgi:hypothetical protein
LCLRGLVTLSNVCFSVRSSSVWLHRVDSSTLTFTYRLPDRVCRVWRPLESDTTVCPYFGRSLESRRLECLRLRFFLILPTWHDVHLERSCTSDGFRLVKYFLFNTSRIRLGQACSSVWCRRLMFSLSIWACMDRFASASVPVISVMSSDDMQDWYRPWLARLATIIRCFVSFWVSTR